MFESTYLYLFLFLSLSRAAKSSIARMKGGETMSNNNNNGNGFDWLFLGCILCWFGNMFFSAKRNQRAIDKSVTKYLDNALRLEDKNKKED